MKLKTYFSLQLATIAMVALMLVPKNVSSCYVVKAAENNTKAVTTVIAAETKQADLRDELLFGF